MKEKYVSLSISLCLAIVLNIVLYLLANALEPGSAIHRILIMLGGSLPAGLIQGFTYFLFFYGVLEIRRMSNNVNREDRAFQMGLLPEKEQFVLSAEEVNQLKHKMIEIEQREPLLLVDLIKKACTKFRANKSVSESLGVVSAQSAVNLRKSESEQSIIRYIAWAVPSVGFIGTVIGIAASLGAADDVVTTGGVKKITSLLNIAFDTTLVALALSLVLMYLYHILQEKVEKLHANIESYVLENLINRIYHREHA